MPAKKPVTVTIPVVFEVDPVAWGQEYGDCDTAAELRAAATEYAMNQISQSPAAEAGAFANVRLRTRKAA